MKKLIVFAMVAAVLTIFNGCQKEESVLIDEQTQLAFTDPMFAPLDDIYFSVEDNRLVFESEKEFQKGINFLAQLGDVNFPKFEKAVGFDSFRKVFEDDKVKSKLFVDELYQTLLNPEKEIVIGNYLFRENPEDEVTLAFYFNRNEDCDLKNAMLSTPTFIFNWHEDAFELINNENQLKSVAGYCDSNNDAKEKDFIIKSGNWGNTTANDPFAYYFDLKAKVCFQKTSIFKSIITKFKLEESNFQCYNSYWEGFENCKNGVYTKASFESVGDAIYKRKNRTKFKDLVYQYFYPWMSEFETSWRPFYGTRRVECYNITMDFKFNIYNGAVSPHFNGYTKTERLGIYCNQSSCL